MAKKRASIKRKGHKKKRYLTHKRGISLVTEIAIVVTFLLIYIFRFTIYREAIAVYTKAKHLNFATPVNERSKINKVFKRHENFVFGADFSHYQGIVDWGRVDTFLTGRPVEFVIVRATMGRNGKDLFYKYNWRNLKEKKVIRGAYHYYRPNENSIKQANNFIKHVKLLVGDMPPILDIEQEPRIQTIQNLRIGLKRWLNVIGEHYGVKPIIYTNDQYFRSYLSNKEFEGYVLWIANYNNVRHPRVGKWNIWQFTDKGNLSGVEGFVDFNVFRGSREELKEILILPEGSERD